MLKPTFRFFIVPLGAICTLATLSAQNPQPRAAQEYGVTTVRQQVVDCSLTTKNPNDVCVITYDGEIAR